MTERSECPYDTDGDGNCGKPLCPKCHPENRPGHKPPDAPRSAGVKRYRMGLDFNDKLITGFRIDEDDAGEIILYSDYSTLEARVAALEKERDALAEDMELHRKRAYTLGVAYLDEVVDDEEPRPSKQYTFEETVLVARAAVAALHPTSEAE